MGSETLADSSASLAPTTVGNYTIERELGRGGMGAVYVGVHQLIGKRAAIKVLLPALSQQTALVDRFFTEARAATQVKHPGIVEVFDYGKSPDGSAYIVMEYLEGESLATRLRTHGRLATATAVTIARQTALALAAAHRAGIVHRDLKPDNIFLVPDVEVVGGERVKLLDFGIAKLVDQPGQGSALTVTGAILGTPHYMSPEQCEGSRAIDHRSDLYSLGCTLFQMLTGRLPFVESGVGGLIGAHLHMAPPRLRAVDPSLPDALDALVDRLLAKSPEARLQSGDEVAAALSDPALGGSTSSSSHPVAWGGTSIPPAPASSDRTPPPMISATTLPTDNGKRRRSWLLPVALLGVLGAGAAALAIVKGRSSDDDDKPTGVGPAPPKADPPKADPPMADPSKADPTKVAPAEPPKDPLPDESKEPAREQPAVAATEQKAVPPKEPKANEPPKRQPARDPAVVAITQAFDRGEYISVFGSCQGARPGGELLLPCVVSACHLRKPVARIWLNRAIARGFVQQADAARRGCLAAGVDLEALPDRPRRIRRRR